MRKSIVATITSALTAIGAASAAIPGLVPMPMEVTETQGSPFQIGASLAGASLEIGFAKNQPASQEAAKFLAECLTRSAGLKCGVREGEVKAGVSLVAGDAALGAEGYAITVNDQGVVIRAAAATGFFYGVQTLRQLMPPAATFGPAGTAKPDFRIPAVEIKDQPAYRWRGLMLDSCRHFFAKQEVEKILDLMASQKLNTFHWHLTDDQGWRIEIRQHPKLTEVGAWRPGIGFGMDPKETTHYRADGKYGGFYSQQDIKEIIAYAATRHITIVPEIELPGHAMAALVAYPQLNCNPEAMAKQTMPEGGTISRDVYCPGKEATFKFLEEVLGEVAALFPSKYIHIGGDECPKDNWKQCAACQKRIKDHGLKNEEELQSYVTKRIETFLNSKGKNLIGWDEILEGGLAPRAAVMSWRGTAGGIKAATEGHDVVMTPTSHCYIDYLQAKQGEPRGIGGFLPLQTVYSFDPATGIPEDKRQHLLGGQVNLWTEYVASDAHAEYMIAPRVSALAEVVWSPKARQDWGAFQARMQDQYLRYQAAGFNYRQPKDGDPK
ncbi:MAG: beta-N-acetylhexosaminidase [Verrucomicrobia bacterium]|nr:beta-N-acetylhexosaminidase [Verrucomicrobiota bacterium]